MATSTPMAVRGTRGSSNLHQQGMLLEQDQQEIAHPFEILPEHTSPRQPQPDERANYDAGAHKATYAKRVPYGEKYESIASNGVQRAEMPVRGAADPQRVNNNLPDDTPMFARSVGDQSHYTFNIDHGSFANEAYRKGSFHTVAFPGRMPGSMLMGRIGSMFGVGAPAASMYGMGSMYGRGMSRPASLLESMYGSQYGMGPAGSMYGMGGPMNYVGSLYSMGMPMGSMMYPMSMTGGSIASMRSMNACSQFAPNGFSSAYGDPFHGNMGGIQYNGASNYGMSGISNGYYQPQFGYGPTGVSGTGESMGFNGATDKDAFPAGPVSQPATLSSDVDPVTAPQQAPPGTSSSSGAPHSTVATPSVAHGRGSERKGAVASLLVISTGANSELTVVLPGSPPMGMPAGEILRTGPDARGTAMEVKCHSYCKGLYNSVKAGHNTALLLATDGTEASRSMVAEVVKEVLAEALSETEKAAAQHGQMGYYDARVSACALSSSTAAIDCVQGSAIKGVEVGSHPVFGPAFLNVAAVTVRDIASDMPRVDAAIATACGRTDGHVVVIEAVVKQVRPAQRGDSVTDVLLSSILFLISIVTKDGKAFFDCFRDEAYVPPALTKGCIGGACRTVAVLCLPHCKDPSTAQSALDSLQRIRNTANSMPRSGNLARFINFAAGENEKLRQKPDVEAAVLEKVDAMLADGRAMLEDSRNTVPVAYPSSSQRVAIRALKTPQFSSRDISAHATEKGRDASNPVRVVVIASPQTSNDLPPTFSVGPDGNSIVDHATSTNASALEVVIRAPEDWRNVTSEQVSEVQTLFQNGNNTAIIGTMSPSEVSTLSKHPLWLSYKRMVSSLLSVATQKYTSAEVSLSVTLLGGNEVLADLLVDMDSEIPAVQIPQKFSVAYSPLFGPTVYKATIIKQPTPLQLESSINVALYHAPTIMKQHPNKRMVIVASAVMKGVTATDVYTSSMLAAGAMDPAFFLDILDRKADVPHELFEYAFGGPCCTLFLAHVIQGDANVARLVELMNRLNAMQNRSVRTCSVKKFIAFAEESLRRADAKAAAARSQAEKETILRSKKSMEVFYSEYKTLIEDPEHHDPRTYRRSGGGSSSAGTSAAAAASADPGTSKARGLATPSTAGVLAEKSRKGASRDSEKSNGQVKKAEDSRSSGSRHSTGHRRASRDGERRPHSRDKNVASARSSRSRHSTGHRRGGSVNGQK